MLSRRQLLLLDALIGVGLALLGAGLLSSSEPIGGPVVVLAALVTGLPLAVRRQWPRAVFGVVLAGAVAGMFVGAADSGWVAAGLALYMVVVSARPARDRADRERAGPERTGRERTRRELARRGRFWIAVITAVGVTGVTVGAPAPTTPTGATADGVRSAYLAIACLGLAWVIARAERARRDAADRAAERLAEQAVAEERLRIARELHDVVAHSMSMIAVKSGVAVHVAETRPAETIEALRTIEATSRDSLREMRRVLGMLRQPDLAPVPTLGDLSTLTDQVEATGVTVRISIDEGASGLPPDLQLAAFRIVQEALTNVIRHAEASTCGVSISLVSGHLRLDIVDDGTGGGSSPAPRGHGQIGMRERASMYGGEFEAGATGDGYRVRASIPVPEALAAPQERS